MDPDRKGRLWSMNLAKAAVVPTTEGTLRLNPLAEP
jgi:hypothetical protein